MALCERCGSIQIARVPSKPADRVVSLFTGRKPFLCRRCGWRARRRWDDNVRVDRSKLALDTWAAYDPDMVALDEGPSAKKKPTAEPGGEKFDLASLDQAAHHQPSEAPPPARLRRSRRDRSKRTRRRAIIGAVAITAGVMFVVVLLGLTGSCSGQVPQ